jgi:hypothetical protein
MTRRTAARPSRIPASLLGAVLLVTLIESALASHRIEFTPGPAWDWHLTVKAAGRQARSSDVLCFGDSTIKLSVAPTVLEAPGAKQDSAYNLALIGGVPPAADVLLRTAIDSGARPQMILLSFTPTLLSRPTVLNLRQFPEILGVVDLLLLAFEERNADLGASLLLARLLPSYKSRLEVRTAVVAAIAGKDNPAREPNLRASRNIRFNRGAQILPAYDFKPNAPREWYEVGFAKPWSSAPGNAYFLERFLTRAERAGLTVAWLMVPLEPEAATLFRDRGQQRRFEHYLRHLQTRHSNLLVIDGLCSDYPRSRFVDPIHVNRHGTAAISDDLRALIARLAAHDLPAERWIELPHFRDRSLPEPLEDEMQSLQFVRSNVPPTRVRR